MLVSREKAHRNIRSYSILLCLILLCSLSFCIPVSADDAITIRAGLYENQPKIFTDEKGNASGFWPDIVKYIALEEGWNIKYVRGTWAQCLERLEKGEIDVMPDVAYTDERNKLYDFSNQTVYVSWSRVYTREGSDIESILDLEGKSIAVLQGSVNVEGWEGIKELVSKFGISCNFIELDSYTKVFELVESGEADVGVASKDFGNQHEAEFDLMETAIIFQPSPLYFAFPKKSNLTPYLTERIDYHMKELKEQEGSIYYQSLEKWLGAKPIERPVIPIWVKWALIGIGGLALLLAGGSYVLRSQVKSRTKELVEEIDERKRAEGALRDSEVKYRTLLENLPHRIFHKDINSTYISCNENYARGLKLFPDEVTGKTDYDFYPGNLAKKYIADDRRVIESGKTAELEEKYVVENKEFWIQTVKAPVRDERDDIVGVIGIFSDITERKEMEQERQEQAQRLLYAMEATIGAISRTIEVRDPYTSGHQNRVADLACAIAAEIRLSEERIRGLRMAGLVHDIGKIHVPAEILSKPSRLNEIEFGMIKQHPQVGYEILRDVEFPWPIPDTVLQHHERLDGSGYPSGLKDRKIILEAKILSVADVVEAMSSHRPYRPSLGVDKALEEISSNSGRLYAPKVVAACLRLFTEKGFKFPVDI